MNAQIVKQRVVTMASLQISASSKLEQFDEVEQIHHLRTVSSEPLPNLDESLAKLLSLIRAHGEEADMNALGKLLSYVEQLEKKTKIGQKASAEHLVLISPTTLTLAS